MNNMTLLWFLAAAIISAMSGCGNPDAMSTRAPPFERTRPATPEQQAIRAGLDLSKQKDAEDGYRREYKWEHRCQHANCADGKVKLCIVIRFFGKNDPTYANNCAKKMAGLRQIPQAIDPHRYYFCLDHGRAIVSVPIGDKARIESLPDDRRICLWLDDPKGKMVAEQFFIPEITRWAEGCPQPTGFNSHPPCSPESLQNEGLFAPELYEQKKIRFAQ